jgi:glyoxylase-like metal-dependent hydrolase (beta-lactamase superfamily II)
VIRDILAPNPGPFTLWGTRAWLLGDTVMIDPGPDIESHVEALLAAQPGVAHILVTHRHADHAPAAVPISRKTGARIFAPPGVLDDAVVGSRIEDGFVLEPEGLSIRAVATPGHTAEHVCFMTADGDLFTGDTVLGEGTTAIFPPDGNMRDYLASLETLLALAPRRIYPGHGPVRDDAVAWIEHYIRHRRSREAQIAAALENGPLGIRPLRAAIYPDLDPSLHSAAEGQLLAHLVHMAEGGRIDWDGSVGRVKS